ncbi:adhesin [Providencia rettgeri]|uniref:Adhesin n=1 Tax=Providencia rettgeri TaxID=587 RepID=A0AAE2ZL46_PRORE|nr:adhesin [Providencia rettgeri]EJD6044913.1 adhesin [Providencia rettgeri]ELR5127426.1 adhesin [Providencia rettgeri]ELR5246440.1 adhesin [Providencia rettgeri]ELS4585617.1 adhesin [Providencia rettgeri]MBW3118810.1 adhesin [Providencia rettgeri]
MKMLRMYSQLLLLLPLCLSSLHAQATRYAGAGGSYNMNLVSNNSVVASTPTIGTDKNKYYLIAPPNSSGIVIDKTTSQPFGQITCAVNFLEGNYPAGLSTFLAYHRVFAYMPEAGFSLNGLKAYRINENTFFTLYSDNGITSGWQKIAAYGCASGNMGPLDTSYFTVQFPFEVRIYVKSIPVDGKIIVPGAMIAGYTRLFQDTGTPTLYVPADKSTVKLDLVTSVVHYPSNCHSSIDNLNIDHKTLDAFDFNSKETRTVTYICEQSQPVKVKLKIDYTTDTDPEKRVPLKSGNNTIYSEVTLYDEQTNQRGKNIETTIDKVKSIRIESHLSGSDAEPGDYKGNAWLISTFI